MIRIGTLVAIGVYGLDRIVKWIAINVWHLPEQPIILTPFFNLVMVWNSGISFGMLQSDYELSRWLLVIFALLVIIFLFAWLVRSRSWLLSLALGMVIGGAASNVTDRIVWGKVADFFSFHLGQWQFPVFNVADTAIVCGFGLIIIDSLFANRNFSKK